MSAQPSRELETGLDEQERDTKKPARLDHSEGREKEVQETQRNHGEFTSSSRSEMDMPFPACAQASLKDSDTRAGTQAPAFP